MYEAIVKMGAIDFAIVVGKFAFDFERYSYGDAESIITRWWHWTDEIAEFWLDLDQEKAVRDYNLMVRETCPECYTDTDKWEGVIEHDSDCSKR